MADFQQLAKNIAGGGTWKVPTIGSHQLQLAQCGTCAFGIRGGQEVSIVYIGNQDIIDVIKSCIANFQWKGEVGAKGKMDCQTLTFLCYFYRKVDTKILIISGSESKLLQ